MEKQPALSISKFYGVDAAICRPTWNTGTLKSCQAWRSRDGQAQPAGPSSAPPGSHSLLSIFQPTLPPLSPEGEIPHPPVLKV